MTDLFINKSFLSHSGLNLSWKIDADALTDADLAALAKLVADRIAFSCVVGVPRGGLRFAAALEQYCIGPDDRTLLIVDDVLTTGGSMEKEKNLHKLGAFKAIVGVVIFARAAPPHWVRPIFMLAPWMKP